MPAVLDHCSDDDAPTLRDVELPNLVSWLSGVRADRTVASHLGDTPSGWQKIMICKSDTDHYVIVGVNLYLINIFIIHFIWRSVHRILLKQMRLQ